jgi:hypothetical protein
MRNWMMVLALIVSMVGLPMMASVRAEAAATDADLSCSFGGSGGWSTLDCTVSNFFETPGEYVTWQDVETAIERLVDQQCAESTGGRRPDGIQLDITTETLSTPWGNPDILVFGTYTCGYWS